MARFTSKHLALTFTDSGAGQTITVGPGQGDLDISPFEFDNSETIEARDRGVHDGLVEGDDLVQDVTITIEVENQAMTDATSDRFFDWIMQEGSFASGAAQAVTSVDSVRWAWIGIATMTQGSNSTVITMPKITGFVGFTEGKETSTFKFTGKNYLKPVVT